MTVDYRANLEQKMRETLRAEANFHNWFYTQFRPRDVPPRFWPSMRVDGDCSKGVQFLCKWAGIPAWLDPMGNNYGPYGNSQTLWVHLLHLPTPHQLLLGDIVTFGYDGEEHSTMVLEPDPKGGNPLLWSFGHQGAPNTYRLNEDNRPAQYLRLGVPVSPKTPEDRLREKTGWFSWVAWRQGEGPWKHYGKANPRVRPNVRRVVPLSWWKRYAKFLLNRKKGS